MTPRFIPWDLPGRCTRCKSGTVEIDYIIQNQGVSIYSSRLKGGERFVSFDKPVEFNEYGYIRIKSRNKILNLPLRGVEVLSGKKTTGDNNGEKMQTIPEIPEPALTTMNEMPTGDIEKNGNNKN